MSRNFFLLSPALLLLTSVAVLAHGTEAPSINPEGLKRELQKHRGKPVVVHFWNAASASDLATLAKLRARGIVVVSIAVEDRSRASVVLAKWGNPAGAFLNQSGEDFHPGYVRWLEPALSDMDGAFLPRTYLVDKSGKIVKASGAALKAFPEKF